MSESLRTTLTILGYNTWLFGNAVKEVNAEQAGFRVSDRTNSFDRLAGHVVVCRHGVAGILQIQVPELPWGSFAEFDMGPQFKMERECPPIDAIVEKFNGVTEVLMAKLPDVADEVLGAPSPFPIPGDDPTTRDLLAFLTMHETYHLGQMGLLKKSMGGEGIMTH